MASIITYETVLTLSQPLVIASGLSVGKEGPSVHVACCIGYVVANFFSGFSRSQSKLFVHPGELATHDSLVR